MIGLIFLFLGIQLRMVDSVVLNEESSRFIAKKMGTKSQATTAEVIQVASFGNVAPRKVIKPPKWVAWALIAAGSVFVLHALALRRPG
jgi:hypothetical protein